MTEPTVVHNAAAQRFETNLDGQLAVVEYQRRGDRVVFHHTEVPDEHEGRGVATAIARQALDWAREQKLKVVPQCPFIADFVKKHQEYADIVDRNSW